VTAQDPTLEVPLDVGQGEPLVILHGFGMRPDTYGGLARLLAERCRVLIPDLFALRGRWRYEDVVGALAATLEQRGLERVTLVGHSFGGGIELGYASRHPHRVRELVFSDTLAVAREWRLSTEVARHPTRLLRLATPRASVSFLRCWVDHPRQLADAAWWAFTSARERDSRAVARAGIPAHVLWANRDSVLSRPDGMRFAEELGATFTVAARSDGRPVDHDWMFLRPDLFVTVLDDIDQGVLT